MGVPPFRALPLSGTRVHMPREEYRDAPDTTVAQRKQSNKACLEREEEVQGLFYGSLHGRAEQ
ncbi:hypothetical protein GCM10010844_21380 [Deinococcus radiotolerans]|uniref:Uncharacterized protein n=1 Tax=Deinococcus radiotolerans TaxID=1309407 RepID=A0ABQ2FJI5_9DEIO|nr:hypothetical protein GCM10010844_21380 [Deinococcus radiotolerans]